MKNNSYFYNYWELDKQQEMNKTLTTNVWCLPIRIAYVRDVLSIIRDDLKSFYLTDAFYNMLLNVIRQINQGEEGEENWGYAIFTLDLDFLRFCIDLGANSTKQMFKVYMAGNNYIKIRLGVLWIDPNFKYLGNRIKAYIRRYLTTI